jgi:hypothetical protein
VAKWLPTVRYKLQRAPLRAATAPQLVVRVLDAGPPCDTGVGCCCVVAAPGVRESMRGQERTSPSRARPRIASGRLPWKPIDDELTRTSQKRPLRHVVCRRGVGQPCLVVSSQHRPASQHRCAPPTAASAQARPGSPTPQQPKSEPADVVAVVAVVIPATVTVSSVPASWVRTSNQ